MFVDTPSWIMIINYNNYDFFATRHQRRMLLKLHEETKQLVRQQLSLRSFKKIVTENSIDET